MVHGCAFPRGEQVPDIGLMVQMDRDSSHKEMNRRRDRDGLLRDINAAVFPAQIPDLRQPSVDDLLPQERDIQKDVPAAQPQGSEKRRQRAAGNSAFPPRGFGNQHVLLRREKRGRMVLDELQVLQIHALQKQLPRRISVTLGGACRLAEERILASGGHHHRVRVCRLQLPVPVVIQKNPITDSLPDEGRVKEASQPAPDQSRRFQPAHFHDQRGDNLPAGRRAAVAGPLTGLAAEGSPRRMPHPVHGKDRADLFQIRDDLRRVFTQSGDSRLSSQAVSAFQGILNMAGDRVPLLVIRKHGVDSAGCHHRLGLLRRIRGDQFHADPLSGTADRAGHPCDPASNDYRAFQLRNPSFSVKKHAR